MDKTDDVNWFKPAPWRARLAVWTAIVLVLGFAAAYLASPLLALGDLKWAAKRHDEAALEKRVDMPRLHASLKGQLAAVLDRPGRKGAGLEASFLLSDSFIDALLTPSNLAALINGAVLSPSNPSPSSPPPAAPAEAPGAAAAPATSGPPANPVRVSGRYAGLNRFEVLVRRDVEADAIVFSFRRQGLFGWVLSDIRLPPAVLKRFAAR